MCFTLFGLTFSIVRAVTTATEATWYPGAERYDAERLIEAARETGNRLYQMH